MGDNVPRFSDQQLSELRQDFDTHVESHEQFVKRFDKHEQGEEAWRIQQGDRMDAMLTAQEHNTQAISELTTHVSSLVTDTKDIIQLHKDFQSTARVGSKIQDLIVWLMKAGGILAALGAGIHYVVTHLKH